MRNIFQRILLISFGLVVLSGVACASSDLNYYKGRVVSQLINSADSGPSLNVVLLNGPSQGKTVFAGVTGLNSSSDISLPSYRPGDIVVVAANGASEGNSGYSVLDHYRLDGAGVLLLLVLALVIIFARWRGIGSIIGLGFSLLVIGGFMIPQILKGQNPYVIVFGGSLVIATFGIYFAHGLSRRTTLALVSTYITLILAALISIVATSGLHLNGISTEDVSYLHQQLPGLDLQGLLLGGIVVGVLGVLDDITVGQATVVEEIHKANKRLSWSELYRRGSAVGREHIASLINTLVLAYVGASFVFILYISSVLHLPLWLSINSELIMEEITRSLIGSAALILAVPIATLLSAYFLTHSFRSAALAAKRLVGAKP